LITLVNFNEHDFSEDFYVFKDVTFNQNVWHIQWAQSEHIKLNFEGVMFPSGRLIDHPELLNFVKMITYYSFPKLVNLNISSWNTTTVRHSGLTGVIKDLFWNHQILTKEMISAITSEQLADHIEKLISCLELGAKGSVNRYLSFVNFLEGWENLSVRELLPDTYKIGIEPHTVLTKKIKEKANRLIEEMVGTWQPLDPDIVKLSYDEASRYIYEYSATIIKCNDLIRNRPVLDSAPDAEKKLAPVRQDGKTKELFQQLEEMELPMIDGNTKLFNFNPVTNKVVSKGYARGWQYRTTINITEIRPAVIKLKRACIFLIALFSGLRRREIAELKNLAMFIKNGEYYLSITRFKTSHDASELGEADEIPIPEIVADAINVLSELFSVNRKTIGSDYLLLSDILTSKGFEKIKIATISKDIKAFVQEVTGEDCHAHQMRKFIAWLLISRSEHNINLIRQLFGHKSYGMTLRYILRNELMVDSVIELIEHNYTEDLNEIFASVAEGKAAGGLAESIRKRMTQQNYNGQVLVTGVESFIHEALFSGVPLFVSRLPIGGFCIRIGDRGTLPPCMVNCKENVPQIEFCDYKNCGHVLHNNESIENIESQITYYQKKLSYLSEEHSEKVVAYYETEVTEHQELLKKLKENQLKHDRKEHGYEGNR